MHRWSSGRIHRCHRCDPGSIPGRCIALPYCTCYVSIGLTHLCVFYTSMTWQHCCLPLLFYRQHAVSASSPYSKTTLAAHGRGGPPRPAISLHTDPRLHTPQLQTPDLIPHTPLQCLSTCKTSGHIIIHAHKHTNTRALRTPPAGLEPAIFGLEVRRLVH